MLFLCWKRYPGPQNVILLQLFKVLCVCNTRVGQIRAVWIRVGQTRAHHCCEYTIADQPSIVLAAKVLFCSKYPRSSAIDNARVGRMLWFFLIANSTAAKYYPSPQSIVQSPKDSICFVQWTRVWHVRVIRSREKVWYLKILGLFLSEGITFGQSHTFKTEIVFMQIQI